MTQTFIEKHGLWSDDQRRQAEDLKARVRADNLQFVRLAWGDPHGASRAKAVTVPTFLAALTTGYARRRYGPGRNDGLAQPHHHS
jgi:glutamine synthetase